MGQYLLQPILPPQAPILNSPWFSFEPLALYKSLTYLYLYHVSDRSRAFTFSEQWHTLLMHIRLVVQYFLSILRLFWCRLFPRHTPDDVVNEAHCRQHCVVLLSDKHTVIIFTRDSIYAIAHICHTNSVCLSHACFVSKRLNVSLKFFHCVIGPLF